MDEPMKLTTIPVVVVLLGCVGCSGGTYVQSAPRPAPAPVRAPTAAPVAAPVISSVSVVLTSDQIAAVRAHFSGNGRGNGNSNGRGRNGGLPPGIARNLERGKALPPGIARQYLPGSLVTVLPDLDRGLEYVVAGGKLLLVEVATQVIRDVLIDAVFG